MLSKVSVEGESSGSSSSFGTAKGNPEPRRWWMRDRVSGVGCNDVALLPGFGVGGSKVRVTLLLREVGLTGGGVVSISTGAIVFVA